MTSDSKEIFKQSSDSGLVCQGGTVTRVDNDIALVKIEENEACHGCGTRSSCGVMLGADVLVEVHFQGKLETGQKVEIGLRPTAIVSASIILFIIPAIVLVLGIIAGYLMADFFGWQAKQWIGLAVGLTAFLLTMLIIKMLSHRFQSSGRYEPVITRTFEKQAEL